MKRVKEISPNASDLNHQSYKIGCDLFKAERFSQAALSFKKALEYWPEDSDAWMALGNCYDSMNKPAKAETCFRRALEHSTEKTTDDIVFNLGNALYDQGRFAEAAEKYEAVTKGGPLWEKASRNIELARKQIENV